jgi:tol-pal system protein YbgF
VLAVLGAMLPLSGCARGESAETKQLAEMREQMNKDEQEHDKLKDRMDVVEDALIEQREERAQAQKGMPPKSTAPTEKPRTVALSPGGGDDWVDPALAGEDPEDTTPRPSIKVQGAPGAPQPRATGRAPNDSRRGAKGGGVAGPDQISTTIPDESPNGGAAGPAIQPGGGNRPAALDPDARVAYDGARNLVVARKYREAIDAFTAFLVKWPDHPMADNAMYWRGECFIALGDYAHAEQELEGALARFPLGNKTPDILLKLGMVEDKLGHADKSRGYYDKLSQDYPKSDAAKRIPAAATTSSPKGPKENR